MGLSDYLYMLSRKMCQELGIKNTMESPSLTLQCVEITEDFGNFVSASLITND